MLVRDNFITHRHRIYRLNIIFNKSLHIFGAVVDAIDAIHSLYKLTEAWHKLLKGLFLNADNLYNYFILH